MRQPTSKKEAVAVKPTTKVQIVANCDEDCLIEVTIATQHNKGERLVTKQLKNGQRTTAPVNHTTELRIKEVVKPK